ncbi:hypothetical protein E3N88_43933 [Mikania micrantha]|uniref:Uncharacterized protein n=1 Tax=Mikania micrantha TaxID=192012 RepID=A0A5N6LDI9_9ASTR|nr:hypothetical protein E3N88_43933 [Mikania micrantha]
MEKRQLNRIHVSYHNGHGLCETADHTQGRSAQSKTSEVIVLFLGHKNLTNKKSMGNEEQERSHHRPKQGETLNLWFKRVWNKPFQVKGRVVKAFKIRLCDLDCGSTDRDL